MPIFVGSRYEGLSYSAVLDDDGITKRFIHLRTPADYVSYVQHELLPAQELDFLALVYLGQSRKWWQLAETNDLFWPLGLEQGTRLDIPG